MVPRAGLPSSAPPVLVGFIISYCDIFIKYRGPKLGGIRRILHNPLTAVPPLKVCVAAPTRAGARLRQRPVSFARSVPPAGGFCGNRGRGFLLTQKPSRRLLRGSFPTRQQTARWFDWADAREESFGGGDALRKPVWQPLPNDERLGERVTASRPFSPCRRAFSLTREVPPG